MGKYVKWDITGKCNLRCAHCSVGKSYFYGKINEIQVEQKLQIIDRLAEGEVEGLSLLGGEPLTMGDDFFSVIDHAISKGLKISLVTNGLLLNGQIMKKVVDSGINHITISMDGASKETHEFVRGKNTFEKLINNIRSLTEYISDMDTPLEVNINTVLNRLNYPEINNIIDLCIQLGVNRWTLLSLGGIGFAEDNMQHLAITPEEELDAAGTVIRRYSSGNLNGLNMSPQFYPLVFDYIEHRYGLKMPKSRICCTASISLGFIGPDGNMYPCDRVASENYIGFDIYGATIQQMNLLEHSFYEIWNSNGYVNMFNLILDENTYKDYTPCNRCAYLKNGTCNPCPLYSLNSKVNIKVCEIIERELGKISEFDAQELLTNSPAIPIAPNSNEERRINGVSSDTTIAERIPVKTAGIRSHEKGEFLILLDPHKVEFITLNLIGNVIWDLIDGKRTVQEIADEVVEVAYEVKDIIYSQNHNQGLKDELDRRILSFFSSLYDLGFIYWISKDWAENENFTMANSLLAADNQDLGL